MAEPEDQVDITEILNCHGLALDARAWELCGRIFKEQIEPRVHRLKRVAVTGGASMPSSRESLAPEPTPPKNGD